MPLCILSNFNSRVDHAIAAMCRPYYLPSRLPDPFASQTNMYYPFFIVMHPLSNITSSSKVPGVTTISAKKSGLWIEQCVKSKGK